MYYNNILFEKSCNPKKWTKNGLTNKTMRYKILSSEITVSVLYLYGTVFSNSVYTFYEEFKNI